MRQTLLQKDLCRAIGESTGGGMKLEEALAGQTTPDQIEAVKAFEAFIRFARLEPSVTSGAFYVGTDLTTVDRLAATYGVPSSSVREILERMRPGVVVASPQLLYFEYSMTDMIHLHGFSAPQAAEHLQDLSPQALAITHSVPVAAVEAFIQKLRGIH